MTAISKTEHDRLTELLQRYEAVVQGNVVVRADSDTIAALYQEYQAHLRAIRELIERYEFTRRRLRISLKQEVKQRNKDVKKMEKAKNK